MKILTLSFYKDFARYFSYLETDAKKNFPKIEFINHVLYPCAKKYFKAKGYDATLIPYELEKSKERISPDTKYYLNFNLDELVNYSKRALKDNSNNTIRKLKERAAAYIDYYEKIFQESHFECIVCSGDTRIPIEACIAVAKRRGIPIWYFEQGPFGTTIIDENGVNTNASFSGKTGNLVKSLDFDLNQYIANIQEKSGGKYWIGETRDVFQRLTDCATLLLMHPPKILKNTLPLELSTGVSFKNLLRSITRNKFYKWFRQPESVRPKNNNPYIALLLQVPHDAQMLIHSPHYTEMETLVRDVIDNSPKKLSVVCREHPLYAGMYGKNLYNTIDSSSRSWIDNKTALNELIDGATCVVVNNSTAGLDAMRRNKTVVVLGQAYYANDNIVYHLHNKGDLSQLLIKASENPIDPELIQRYLSWLLSDKLIAGHYHDKNLSNSASVIKRISNSCSSILRS
jgi:capsular polysaccharide export protein